MMNTIVQWATIPSPIFAVAIAAFTCWLNARDVKRQIKSVRELSQQTIDNTTKEVESIKGLARLQIEASIRQVELEIEKYGLLAEQARHEAKNVNDINMSQLSYLGDYRSIMTQKNKEERPQRDFQLYNGFIQRLGEIKSHLKGIKL